MAGKLEMNATERTVLVYVRLAFYGKWEWAFEEYSFRPVGAVGARAALGVVCEGATGTEQTHWFIVRRRPDPPGGINTTDHVIVPTGENIVYVPERCVRRDDGDTTRCSEVLPPPVKKALTSA
jgi:hypothetical protein